MPVDLFGKKTKTGLSEHAGYLKIWISSNSFGKEITKPRGGLLRQEIYGQQINLGKMS